MNKFRTIVTIFLFAIVMIAVTIALVVFRTHMEQSSYAHTVRLNRVDNKTKVHVYGIRKFPYPYQAMLTLASDADHQTLRKFNLIHEFLNTREITPMGRGLGLDIADSFFMYNGSNIKTYTDYNHIPLTDELTYFKGTSNQGYGGDIINSYIADGWIDSIHTFGDFSMRNQNETLFTRELAKQAIATLKEANDNISVWIDHGNMSNVDNFGSYGIRVFYNYQQGANPHSVYYHTNYTIPYGIQFVWADQSSNEFGRNTSIYPLKLPDGQYVWGFWRYTDKGITNRGIEWVWGPKDLSQEITPLNLKAIIKNHQYAIIAQHLCGSNSYLPLQPNAIHALQFLAENYYKRKILVTRTSRLLHYNVTQQFLKYDVTYQSNGTAVIHIRSIDDPVLGYHIPSMEELRGITFYTSDPKSTVIEIGNNAIPVKIITTNPSDGYAPSISITWFPTDVRNYVITNPKIE